MEVQFYFDAMCPWTWLTSRWLVDVAGQRDVDIVWRTFSLPLLNEGRPIPPALLEMVPDLVERLAVGSQILRLVESLRAAGRNDDIGRFYTECGLRFHVGGVPPDRATLDEAARAAGVADQLPAADDEQWDPPLRASLHEAMTRAGPDIGSPVIVLDGYYRGIFGPIVSPPPEGEDAVRLWDALVTLISMPRFLEIKRGRPDPPEIPGA
jgi:predicted DsbA family dithiol-disulfide isomerase